MELSVVFNSLIRLCSRRISIKLPLAYVIFLGLGLVYILTSHYMVHERVSVLSNFRGQSHVHNNYVKELSMPSETAEKAEIDLNPNVQPLNDFTSSTTKSSEILLIDRNHQDNLALPINVTDITPIPLKTAPIVQRKGQNKLSQHFFHYIGRVNMTFPTQFPSPNLIMGVAFDIDSSHLAIFANSLRKSNITATVVLFIDNDVKDVPHFSDIIIDNNIICIHIDVSSLSPAFIRRYHPSSIRWILYDRLLNSEIIARNVIQINQDDIDNLYTKPFQSSTYKKLLSALFDKVLVLDVRDSAFQSDPFPLLPASPSPSSPSSPLFPRSVPSKPSDRHKLLVFAEDPEVKINQCTWNTGWIQDCFSYTIFDVIQTNFIICSGISLGYIDVMLIYTHYMSLLLRGKKMIVNAPFDSSTPYSSYNYLNNERVYKGIDNYEANGLTPVGLPVNMKVLKHINEYSSFPKCERNGVDQGMHNVLIFLNVIPVKIMYLNFPIINLQSAMREKKFIFENDVLQIKGINAPYALVHQYDRYEELQNTLANKYVPWINISNPVQELRENQNCRPYKLAKGIDMMRTLCDLKSQRVLSIGACCDLCYKLNNYPTKSLQNNTQTRLLSSITSYEGKNCTGFTFNQGVCYLKKCSEQEHFKGYLQGQGNKAYKLSFPNFQANALSLYLPFSNPEYVDRMKSLPFKIDYNDLW